MGLFPIPTNHKEHYLHCPLCTNTTQTFTDEKTTIVYYHCKNCHYIFKSPKHYQTIKEQKARYDLHQNNEEDTGYIAYFNRFIDFMNPHITKVENALDFGCGCSTLLANILKEKGIECDVYDPLYYPTLKSNKKYDLIVSTEVFEHLHNPKEVFASLVEKLKPNGYLALQTQFHNNEIETFKKWYYHHDTTHIVFFRSETFRVLGEMYGCRLIADNGKNMVILQKNML